MPTENQNGDANATPADPPAITKDEIRTIVSGIVRESLSKSLPKAIQEAVKGAIETEIAPLRERLDSKPKDESQGDDDASKATTKPSTQPPANAAPAKPDPELEKLRKQIEGLTAKQRETEKRAAEAERRRIETEGYAALRSTLTGKVAAGAEDAVLAMLRGRNAVAIGDDGAVRLKLRASQDEPEDGLDLDDGIAAFLKTPEAKFFVPAPNGGAGGTKPRTGPLQPTQPGTRPGAARPTSPISAFEQATGESIDSLL